MLDKLNRRIFRIFMLTRVFAKLVKFISMILLYRLNKIRQKVSFCDNFCFCGIIVNVGAMGG